MKNLTRITSDKLETLTFTRKEFLAVSAISVAGFFSTFSVFKLISGPKIAPGTYGYSSYGSNRYS